ncbi:MAG: cell division protein FtsB [Sideroxydans sp.]|nr:cell division protein FtsB [Sideroxydans sp.]
MRWVSLILVALILLLQYPLWLGKGGWLKVWDINQQVEAQKQTNLKAKTRNAVLDAEVRDLKQGTDAIEERARSELGMVRQDEAFFQVVDDNAALSPASAVAPADMAGKRLNQTPSSSTSKTNVASGGITPPAPRRP